MKMQTQRSITINKPKQNVYEIITDLGQWNIWSPWMHNEPTAKTQISGKAGEIGHYQTWNGEVVGSGKMTIESLAKNSSMTLKLEFFTPWKSLASAHFEVSDAGKDQTKVTWTMNSQLPIFMIFFKNMIKAYMNSDFDRGLKMLKEYAETGTVVSKSIYQGEQDFSGFQVIGKKVTCQISDLSTAIRGNFESMANRLNSGELAQPEGIVTLSHNHNIPKGTSEFTAGYLYKLGQNVKVPKDLEVTEIPQHKALLVDFYGPYRNIGNAWSMAVSYQRGKKKKLAKKIPMYEIYKTMPDGRPEKDIHTQIKMPIK